MTKDEALKLALEAIEYVHDTGDTQTFDMCYADKAITAIKEALAQEQDGQCKRCTDGCPACDARKLPEQEPVAGEWIVLSESVGKLKELGWNDDAIHKANTPQREFVGLTYEEETELIRLAHNHAGIRFYIQAAEAKLKEKNNV